MAKRRRKTKAPPLALELFPEEAPSSPAALLEPADVEPCEASAASPQKPAETLEEHETEPASLAVREVLGFRVEHFPQLPAGSTLHCEAADGSRFVFTTSKTGYQAALEERTPAFVGGELLNVARAAQNDRMFPDHFAGLLERKRDPLGATVRVTQRDAFAGVSADKLDPLRWTFARVLERIGARLVRVEF